MLVEILPRPDAEEAQPSATTPGVLGAAAAVLTMLAALGVGFVALFGKTLFAAALVCLTWPRIFSPQFTAWLFGDERIVFWKVFLLILTAGFVAKLFRRQSWQRK